MPPPPHSIRRCILAASLLWVLISIAAIIAWFIGEWDQYSHLDRHWNLMYRDLPDAFWQSILWALAGVFVVIYASLSPRRHITATAAISAGVAAWGVGIALRACAELVGFMMYYHPVGGMLLPDIASYFLMGLNNILLNELSRRWAFTVILAFVLTAISQLPICSRVVRRPASYALVGLATGLTIYFLTLLWCCLYYIFLGYPWHYLDRFYWVDCASAVASGFAFGYVFAIIIRHRHGRIEHLQSLGHVSQR